MNTKKIALFFSICSGVFVFISGACDYAYEQNLEIPRPEESVIAFDLHGVVFKLDYFSLIQKIITNPRLLWQFPLLASSSFRENLRIIRSETRVWEQMFDRLEELYPDIKECRSIFMSLANAQTPNEDMIKLIEKLRVRGYRLYILSNIGPTMLNDVYQTHPEIMSLFLGKYTPTVENKYHHKPQPEFYEKFKKYLVDQGQEGKRVVFIDDHDDNLKVATQSGFVSVKFKSAEQLQQIFEPKSNSI